MTGHNVPYHVFYSNTSGRTRHQRTEIIHLLSRTHNNVGPSAGWGLLKGLRRTYLRTLSPNSITLFGFCLHICSTLLLAMSSPQNETQWRVVLFIDALLSFAYVIADSLDGKQARRLKQSSPLGQLLDHGCDSLNAFCFLYSVIKSTGIKDPSTIPQLFAVIGCVFVSFQLIEYFQNVLYFGTPSHQRDRVRARLHPPLPPLLSPRTLALGPFPPSTPLDAPRHRGGVYRMDCRRSRFASKHSRSLPGQSSLPIIQRGKDDHTHRPLQATGSSPVIIDVTCDIGRWAR